MYRYCMHEVTAKGRPSLELSLYFFDDLLLEVPMSGPDLLPLKSMRFWSRHGDVVGDMMIEAKESEARDERRATAQRAVKDGDWRSLEIAVPVSGKIPFDLVSKARVEKVWWRFYRLVVQCQTPKATHVYKFQNSRDEAFSVAAVLREALGDRFVDRTG